MSPVRVRRWEIYLYALVFGIFLDDDDEKWWSKLNACKWLKYISKALHGAASLAKLLNFRNIELAGKRVDDARKSIVFHWNRKRYG